MDALGAALSSAAGIHAGVTPDGRSSGIAGTKGAHDVIFLTSPHDHPEPAPLRRPGMPRPVPTIAAACGFGPRDYVPDAMAAPLGQIACLCPGGNGHAARRAPPPDTLEALARAARPPERWGEAAGTAALFQFLLNDIAALCDRVPGLSHPEEPDPPPLDRRYAVARLGNLRRGVSTLDSLYGGACLQGSLAEAARRALRCRGDAARLRRGACADRRNAAHPDLSRIAAALVAAHGALAGSAAPEAQLRRAWHRLVTAELLPLLAGPAPPQTRTLPPGILPLEALLGPAALLPLAMRAEPDAPPAAQRLAALLHRSARLSLAGAEEVLATLDPGGVLPRAPARMLPDSAGATPLPLYLMAEARAFEAPLFGPLGRLLMRLALAAALPPPAAADATCASGPAEAPLRAVAAALRGPAPAPQ